MIHPSSTIMSSMTRPPAIVARQTAVYLRRGAPCSTRNLRHSSGSTLARRFRGGNFECIAALTPESERPHKAAREVLDPLLNCARQQRIPQPADQIERHVDACRN